MPQMLQWNLTPSKISVYAILIGLNRRRVRDDRWIEMKETYWLRDAILSKEGYSYA